MFICGISNLHNNLSLHPPQSSIYKVLYEEIVQDSRKLKDPNVKTVIEQYIKKTMPEVPFLAMFVLDQRVVLANQQKMKWCC